MKRTRRDRDGRFIPDDHVADFHYMDDARDIWNAVKGRFGGNAESKKIRKSMRKQEFSKFRIEDDDINLKFLRALPSSWSQVALTLKTKGGLELLSFIKIVSTEDSDDVTPPVWPALVGWEYYENHPVARAGLILWGDLQLLFDSHDGVVSKSIAGSRFSEDSSMLLPFGIQCCWFEFKYADAAFSRDISLTMYVVPTGRVVVPTGRVLSPGRIRIVVPG
nr:ribonuclease H-like domain-containing protein [Tanacetum cinerariifolium]